jgi:hypothetical protein
LRERYEGFLEEERKRRERNDRILQTLDRIESRAAVLTAKSERLRLLRVSNLSKHGLDNLQTGGLDLLLNIFVADQMHFMPAKKSLFKMVFHLKPTVI